VNDEFPCRIKARALIGTAKTHGRKTGQAQTACRSTRPLLFELVFPLKINSIKNIKTADRIEPMLNNTLEYCAYFQIVKHILGQNRGQTKPTYGLTHFCTFCLL